jgi:hypothetical protein
MGWTNRQWDDYVRQQPNTYWGQEGKRLSEQRRVAREASQAARDQILERPPESSAGASSHTTGWIGAVGWLAFASSLVGGRITGLTWGEAAVGATAIGLGVFVAVNLLVFTVRVTLVLLGVLLKVALMAAVGYLFYRLFVVFA